MAGDNLRKVCAVMPQMHYRAYFKQKLVEGIHEKNYEGYIFFFLFQEIKYFMDNCKRGIFHNAYIKSMLILVSDLNKFLKPKQNLSFF